MIKKTITYSNLDGVEVSEDYWFQITKAEFVKKALKEGGEVYLNKLRALSELTEKEIAGKGRELMETFEMLLGDAVGKREGDLFIKNDEIKKRFLFSGAYDKFFMDLIEGPDSGAAFLSNVLPKGAQEEIEKEMKKRGMTVEGEATEVATPAQPTPFPESLENAVQANSTPEMQAVAPQLEEAGKDDEPAWYKESRYPTSKELMKAGPEELALAMKMKNAKAFG